METIVKVDGKLLSYAQAKKALRKKFKNIKTKTLSKKTY